MRIGIMGPQGSGKSTQAKLLAQKLGLCVIDTGELVRARAKSNDSTASFIRQQLEKGQLVGDQIPGELIEERIAHPDCQNGYVIDGYPRSLGQFNFFDPKFERMVYLDLSDEIAVERLMKRGRGDDQPETIKQRLAIFHQNTKEILKYYEDQGKLVKVDADQEVEKVFKSIEETLNG